jgi:hypothetical protein
VANSLGQKEERRPGPFRQLLSWRPGGHANARQTQTVDSRGRVAEIVLPDSSPRRRIERRPSSPRLRAFSLSQEQRKRLMVRERG